MDSVNKITQVYAVAVHLMPLVKPDTVTRIMEQEIEKPEMQIP